MSGKCSHDKKLQGEECLLCEKIWHEYWIAENTQSLERHQRKLAEVNEQLKNAAASPSS